MEKQLNEYRKVENDKEHKLFIQILEEKKQKEKPKKKQTEKK